MPKSYIDSDFKNDDSKNDELDLTVYAENASTLPNVGENIKVF